MRFHFSRYCFKNPINTVKRRIDVILTAGDSYTILGNTPHSFELLEDGEVVDVFTPHREDYL